MFKEAVEVGNGYRDNYRKGLEGLLETLEAESCDNRKQIQESIRKNPERCRQAFAEMLGWPLTRKDDTVPPVQKTLVGTDGDVSVYRMVFDILSVPFYGILFVREDGKKRPLVIAQHGGLGSPEVCGDMLEIGTENYNQMVHRALKHDVNVFAPQLLLWRKEFANEAYTENNTDYTNDMRNRIDNRLKQFGGSIAALEIYCIKKALDYFEREDYVESKKIGMIGLSYGGFYTLYTAATEPRIQAALSCAFFNSRLKYNWFDWVWKNSGNTYTDVEAALLTAPRSLYLSIGQSDPLFDYETGRQTWAELEQLLLPQDRIYFDGFEGVHEFIVKDDVLEKFMHDLKNPAV